VFYASLRLYFNTANLELHMLTVVVLICSLSTAPKDCSEANALVALHGGDAKTAMSCAMEAQATLARSALKPTAGQEYAKINCERVRTAKSASIAN